MKSCLLIGLSYDDVAEDTLHLEWELGITGPRMASISAPPTGYDGREEVAMSPRGAWPCLASPYLWKVDLLEVAAGSSCPYLAKHDAYLEGMTQDLGSVEGAGRD